MGLIKSQGLYNTIISYIGIAIGYLNFLLLIPYAMLPEQIGIIRVLQNSAALLVPIAQLGTISVITRYYHFNKDDETQKYAFLSFNLVLGAIGLLLTLVALIIFKTEIISLYIDNAPEIAQYYYFVIILITSLLFFEFLEIVAANHFKTVFPHVLKQLFLRISITIFTVLFIFQLITFYTFIALMVISYALSFIILLYYLKMNKSVQFSVVKLFRNARFSLISKKYKTEILKYGAYAILYASGSVIVVYIDTLMLGSMLGLAEVGIYTTAFYIAIVIEVPRRSINRIANPLVAEAWKNNDLPKIEEMYKKVSINQLITGFFVLLIIWFNLDYLFDIIPNGEYYSSGKYVVLLVMIGKLIDMAASLNGEIISYSKHFRFNVISIIILSILAIITNLLLIPIYGINGAAVATLISILLFNLIRFIYVWKKFSMTPFSFQTIKVLLISAGVYGLMIFIDIPIHPIIGIVIISIIISILFWVSIYFSEASQDINTTVKKYLKFL